MHANFQDPIPACAGMTKRKENKKTGIRIPVLSFYNTTMY
jgi:hypothetical protein